MPELTIEAGADPKKIIPELQAGQEFNLAHVGGGKVHLDHNKRDVTNDPQRVGTVGDEGPIRSPDVADVWAYAPDTDARLRVSPKGFIWDLFSNKAVERPQDSASRQRVNERSVVDVSGLGSAASTTAPILLDGVDGELRVYEVFGWLTAATAGVDVNAIEYSFNVRDADGNTDEGMAGTFGNFPYSPESAYTVPSGGDIEITVYNYDSNAVDLSIGVRYEVV